MAETPFMSAYLSAANRVAKTVVGRGKWPGLIELFGAVLTADPSRHTRRPAVMPPAARIATHMCSKREPFSATKVRQTIRSFTGEGALGAGNGRRARVVRSAGGPPLAWPRASSGDHWPTGCPFTCRVRNALPFLVMPGTSVIGPSTPNGFPAGGSQRSNRRSNNVQRFWPDAWTISVWISATVSRTSMVEPCRKWISTWPSSIDCQNVTWWQLTNIAVGSTPSLNRPITPFTMMFTL